MAHRIRVLLAKVGLDGHDRGVKVVARTLRDAGMDVVYSGLHRTPEEVVNAAVQEDVDVLGVSLLSGVQMTVFPKIFSLLKEKGVDDMIVVAGGVMPDEDVAEFKKMGVAEIMLQDTPPAGDRRPTHASGRRARSPVAPMEDWSFPPAYDESYLPQAGSRYWFPQRETMHPADREKAILYRLREVCRYAYDNAPFYRANGTRPAFIPSS